MKSKAWLSAAVVALVWLSIGCAVCGVNGAQAWQERRSNRRQGHKPAVAIAPHDTSAAAPLYHKKKKVRKQLQVVSSVEPVAQEPVVRAKPVNKKKIHRVYKKQKQDVSHKKTRAQRRAQRLQEGREKRKSKASYSKPVRVKRPTAKRTVQSEDAVPSVKTAIKQVKKHVGAPKTWREHYEAHKPEQREARRQRINQKGW